MSMSTAQRQYARMLLADPGSSAIQSILLSATAGTWTISFNGQTTAALALGVGANVVENALVALSTIGVGNLTVNNTSPYTLYFEGDLANAAQPMVTVNTAGLTGASLTITKVAQGGVLAFSDSELDVLYTEADTNFYRAVQYGYRTLAAQMSRLNDYIAGQSQEKRSQVFDHLLKLEELYAQWANAGEQVLPTRLTSVPPRMRAYPRMPGVPSSGVSLEPPYPGWDRRRGWRGNW